MAQFSFKVDDTKVTKKMSALAKGVKDFSEPLNEAGEEMLELYGKKTFMDQGATGEPWRKLSAATLMMREKRVGYYKQAPVAQGKTLIWTGALMNGFSKTVNSVRLMVENTVPYFEYHQARGGKTPQRRMLYLNSKIINIVVQKVVKHTEKLIK